jgi:hypothetical protein
MTRSPRERLLYLLSVPFTLAPFIAALIRLLQTGSDLRMLWMAFASFLGTSIVMAIGKTRSGTAGAVLVFSAITLVVATLLAGVTAYALDARNAVGVWLVAFVMGLSWAASYAFFNLSRPRPV